MNSNDMKKLTLISLIIGILLNVNIVTANWSDDLFDKAFTSGDILGAVLDSYTNIAGSCSSGACLFGGFFYLIFFFLGLLMIYMKTHNFGNVAVIGLLMAPFFAWVGITYANIMVVYYSIGIMIALGIALILYRLVH